MRAAISIHFNLCVTHTHTHTYTHMTTESRGKKNRHCQSAEAAAGIIHELIIVLAEQSPTTILRSENSCRSQCRETVSERQLARAASPIHYG